MARRVTIYTRVSEARGPEETSTDRQLAACTKHAESQDGTVVAHHTDRGISGYTGAVRPGWRKVLEDVEAERTDVVLVFALDRAGRNAADLLKFVQTCKAHDVSFVSATQPIDTGSTYGGVIIAVLAAVAEIESAVKSERALSKSREKKESGEWTGGRRGFGYTLSMDVVPDEAAAIRRGAFTVLNGGSLATVARDWSRSGRKWNVSAVKAVFTSPRIIGMQRLDGGLVRGNWEPILTRTDWDRVAALLDGRRGQSLGGARYLLTGLLDCGRCGGKLVGRPSDGKPRYICKATGRVHLTIDAAGLDSYVLSCAGEVHLEEPEEVSDLSTADPAKRARLSEVEALLDEQADQLAAGIPRAVVAKAARKLEAERRRLAAEIEKSAQRSGWAHLADLVEPVTSADWRAAIEEVVERITVRPAGKTSPRFQRERVEIHWRDGVVENLSLEDWRAMQAWSRDLRVMRGRLGPRRAEGPLLVGASDGPIAQPGRPLG